MTIYSWRILLGDDSRLDTVPRLLCARARLMPSNPGFSMRRLDHMVACAYSRFPSENLGLIGAAIQRLPLLQTSMHRVMVI